MTSNVGYNLWRLHAIITNNMLKTSLWTTNYMNIQYLHMVIPKSNEPTHYIYDIHIWNLFNFRKARYWTHLHFAAFKIDVWDRVSFPLLHIGYKIFENRKCIGISYGFVKWHFNKFKHKIPLVLKKKFKCFEYFQPQINK